VKIRQARWIGGWSTRVGFLALAMLAAGPTAAYGHQPVTGVAEATRTWNPDPLVMVVLAGVSVLYLLGRARLRTPPATRSRIDRVRPGLMFAGIALLAVALVSPLDALSSVLFSAHMTQHLVLTVLAPLLLVLSRPVLPLMLGLPARLRRLLSRRAFALRPLTSGPVAAGLMVLGHAAVLWLWHVPALYESALSNPAVHAFEHTTLFVTALLVWSVSMAPTRPGLGLAALVFTALQGVALGALLTFSSRVLYPSYQAGAWGLTALEHQQLGGLLMWMPTGVVYVACCLWVLGRRAGLSLADTTRSDPPRLPEVSRG